MKKALTVSMGTIAALILFASLFAWQQARSFLDTAPEEVGQEVHIRIRPGMSFDKVAAALHEKHVITSVSKFRLLARYRKLTGSIQAGEFIVNTGWTPDQVLDMLVKGMPVQYRLQFPEGLAWWDVAKAVEAQEFARAGDFRQVIHDPAFLKENNIPFDNAEGFLFPETYLMDKPEIMTPRTAWDTASRLVKTFWAKTSPLWPAGPPPAEELRRILTIASLVEKETSVPEERALVAGVYVNRIRRNMLLQADPTIIYGIGPAFNGNITRADLRNATNPYNTYSHPGLPPTPICSPGLESIRAALSPQQHAYLYFVARGDGSHQFSKTLQEHNAAVAKYQLRRGRR
ncbi:endolytic transglycosylase MltG [Desulfovibrio subterraneus]|uniref:Endolytic murein transglycosylase n=1 Tax=Desulfovibrio subterraneus TaxID=2718620 RepID=A0A7J0BDU9_9BACT|nr:endolytic transglycosylase MltG [Desulfovibrio subterraneus]WBF66660.1 endolytic transglycosylase MltG [Desulfovibrio subterraneus]GFM31698.1 aminodeoxychorismate lyase [Desulfovibrio subterraneus]